MFLRIFVEPNIIKFIELYQIDNMVLNKELNTDGRLPSDGTQDEPM